MANIIKSGDRRLLLSQSRPSCIAMAGRRLIFSGQLMTGQAGFQDEIQRRAKAREAIQSEPWFQHRKLRVGVRPLTSQERRPLKPNRAAFLSAALRAVQGLAGFLALLQTPAFAQSTGPTGTMLVQMQVSDTLTEKNTGAGEPGPLSASASCTMSSQPLDFGVRTLTAQGQLPANITAQGGVSASCTTGGAGGVGKILIQGRRGHGGTGQSLLMTLNDVNSNSGIQYSVYTTNGFTTLIAFDNPGVYTPIDYSESAVGGRTLVTARIFGKVVGNNLGGGPLTSGVYKDTLGFTLTY